MTRTALLGWPVFKEVRALLFPWLACAVAMIVPTLVLTRRDGTVVEAFAYVVGATVLGALSIGHEYMARTLTLLLSVPVRRERLLVIKLGVLGAMLMTLGALAYMHVFREFPGRPAERLVASLLPVLGGLFITPWLTMACRSPVAGIVLTIAIPCLLVMLGGPIAFLVTQIQHVLRLADRTFTMAFVWGGISGMCAIGAVATWRMFMRLEATEALEDLRLPPWPRLRTTALRLGSGRHERKSNGASSAGASLMKGRPLWLLVTKELQVQYLALVMAGLYLLGWLACTLLLADDYRALYVELSPLYAGLLGMLTGAIASAEERQLGTIEWQVLQPIAMWKQWAVKMGVVLGLPMLLGIGLPTVLAYIGPAARATPFAELPVVSTVLLLTAGSLYVSSLCASGALALVMSAPATIGAFWFQTVALVWVKWAVAYPAWSRVFRVAAHWGINLRGLAPSWVVDVFGSLLVAGFIGMVLRFARANHCSAERSPWRVGKQVMLMAAFVTTGAVILGGLEAFVTYAR
jgi:hypothetical protein